MHAIGIPHGRSKPFYRDFVLGLIGFVSTLWVAMSAAVGIFDWPFVALTVVAVLSLAACQERRSVIAAIFAFGAIRFALASVFNYRPLALLLTAGCALIAAGVLSIGRKRSE